MSSLPPVDPRNHNIVSTQNNGKSYNPTQSNGTPQKRQSQSNPRQPLTKSETSSPIRQEAARPNSISNYPDVEIVSSRRSADTHPHTHLVPVEKCWKCLLHVDHRFHDTQRFIRIGGGYRHGYYYLQVLLEQIEIERQQAEILRARLETVKEKGTRMIKTIIRTKSGKLIEKIIMVSEEDYEKITKAMGGRAAGNAEVSELLKKYMSSEEAGGIQSLDTSEQKAITATFRTSSGRIVEKVIYVSKDDYDAMQRGEIGMNDVLAKQADLKDLLGAGTTLEGWKESKMKTITTTIRTKSGRLIEQRMQITEEDYRQLQAGKDLGIVLKKYMDADQAAKVQGWAKPEKTEMMAIKTVIRTKSGRLIERTALLTKAEYEAFQRDGANPEALKAYLGLTATDKIEKIEAAASVLSVSDDEAEEGEIVQDKQGNLYQYVTDPITGKLFKKKLDKVADRALIAKATAKQGGIRVEGAKGGAAGGKRNKAGGNKAGDNDSDDSYSYQSVRSAGGTRHVMRQHKREDGTYSPAESFHGEIPQAGDKKKKRNGKKGAGDGDDEDRYSYRSEVSAGGRRHVKRTKVHADGTRSPEVSDHGSVDSDGDGGGKKVRKTVKVLTKKPIFDEHGNVIGEELVEEEVVLADSDDEDGVRRRGSKAFKKKIIKVVKKKPIYDADGNIIGEELVEEEVVVLEEVDGNEADDEDEGGGTNRRRKKGKGNAKGDDDDEEDEYYMDESGNKVLKPKNKKKNAGGAGAGGDKNGAGESTGKRKVKKINKDGRIEYIEEESESDFSVYSVVSAGGTKRQRKKRKLRDKEGKLIGYADSESYSSDSADDDDDDYSVYTEESEGGTRRVAKRKRIRNKSGKVIGYARKQVLEIPEGVEYNQDPDFIIVPDGKGGTIRIPKLKKGDAEKDKQGKRGKGKLPVSSLSPVFSEASTDEEEEKLLLEGMTEEEKKVYLEEKSKRKKAREKRRIEKYGEEKYKEMAAEEEKRKKYRSMVTYSRGGSRFGSADSDNRDIGLGHDQWGKKKPRGKKADGDESDASTTETFVEDADGNKIRVLRKGSKIIKKIKANGEVEDVSDNLADDEELVVETRNIYDEYGNVIGTKKIMQKRKKDPTAADKKKKKEEEEVDDGDYFEKDEQGNYKLKPGKKKIDISKLSKEDLKKLGLDPDNMSKADMMRALKQKFGDSLEVNDRGKKIGTKRLSDYGYNPTIAELADDLDLDLSTLRGPRRLAVLQKRFGPQLQEHVRNLIDVSKLKDNIEPEEAAQRSIDFITAYKLVDNSKLEAYAKAFAVEDEDLDHKLSYKAARLGLESVPSIGGITEKQMDYVMSILGIDRDWPITFRMFAVIVALCERVTAMDGYCKELIEIVNLLDIDRKLQLYKQMFYCNEASDRSATHIQIDALRIELIAGGLSWDQQNYVVEKLQPSGYGEVSFLDYLCYIPLFLSMHENICDNPLDMSNAKYQARPGRAPSPGIQRDMVPLGMHMRRNNMVHRSKFAEEARRLLNPGEPVDKDEQVQKGTELLQKKPGGANLRNLMK